MLTEHGGLSIWRDRHGGDLGIESEELDEQVMEGGANNRVVCRDACNQLRDHLRGKIEGIHSGRRGKCYLIIMARNNHNKRSVKYTRGIELRNGHTTVM